MNSKFISVPSKNWLKFYNKSLINYYKRHNFLKESFIIISFQKLMIYLYLKYKVFHQIFLLKLYNQKKIVISLSKNNLFANIIRLYIEIYNEDLLVNNSISYNYIIINSSLNKKNNNIICSLLNKRIIKLIRKINNNIINNRIKRQKAQYTR